MGAATYAVTVFMMAATFAIIRIIVPGLINLHNDGALILAIMLVVAMPIAWYYFWKHILRPFFEGKYR